MLDGANTAREVCADNARRSGKNEAMFAQRCLVSRPHRKKPPGRPIPWRASTYAVDDGRSVKTSPIGPLSEASGNHARIRPHGEWTKVLLTFNGLRSAIQLDAGTGFRVMDEIRRDRGVAGLPLFSGGFRPFFLAAALWAALVVPVWLAWLTGQLVLPTRMAPIVWHVHELVFGFGVATVTGFLLTAIPNWTGRLPLNGIPLALLTVLWVVGRIATVFAAWIGTVTAAVLDLAFLATFLILVLREILAGRNWRNLPVVGALALLLLGNLLVHIGGLGLPDLELPGLRLGVATILLLIGLIGGRIIPSFTRNWLVKNRPDGRLPAPFGMIDKIGMGALAVALLAWVVIPDKSVTSWAAVAGSLGIATRLSRWCGLATVREPLLWVLHLGYGWLAFGLLLLACNGFWAVMPTTAALHALTAGCIGTMTLAVMTRASLGHTGRPLRAGPRTTTIYGLITLAAALRLLAPLAGDAYVVTLWLAGLAWSGAFGLFALSYAPPLMAPRPAGGGAQPI